MRLRRHLGHDRLLPGRPLGVRLRRLRRPTTGGWIANELGAIDFAGGTAVHINAGAAGLALALVLGKRVGWPRSRCARTTCRSSCSAPACCGSAGSASTPARRSAPTARPAVAWINTLVATGAAMLGWLLMEKIRDGHADLAGCRLRRRRRPGRHHPGLLRPSTPVGALVLGFLAGVALCPGRRPEVPASASTTASTSSASTSSAASSARCSSASSPRDAPRPAGVDGLFYGGGVDQLWRRPSVPSRC